MVRIAICYILVISCATGCAHLVPSALASYCLTRATEAGSPDESLCHPSLSKRARHLSSNTLQQRLP